MERGSRRRSSVVSFFVFRLLRLAFEIFGRLHGCVQLCLA